MTHVSRPGRGHSGGRRLHLAGECASSPDSRVVLYPCVVAASAWLRPWQRLWDGGLGMSNANAAVREHAEDGAVCDKQTRPVAEMAGAWCPVVCAGSCPLLGGHVLCWSRAMRGACACTSCAVPGVGFASVSVCVLCVRAPVALPPFLPSFSSPPSPPPPGLHPACTSPRILARLRRPSAPCFHVLPLVHIHTSPLSYHTHSFTLTCASTCIGACMHVHVWLRGASFPAPTFASLFSGRAFIPRYQNSH